MNNPVERLLGHLEKVRPNGRDRWIACCSGHRDRSPSLTVRVLEDGRILIHCFAGCDPGDVLAAIGLTFRDLFPDNPDRPGRHWRNERLRAALRHEWDVLTVALADLDAGSTPSPADAQRALAARRRIDKLQERLDEPQRL